MRAHTIKHTGDVVLATLAIVVLIPILISIALAVKATSRGPVLYRQRRVGRYGLPFEILKFRTMNDAPAASSAYVVSERGPGFEDGGDRRTLVGAFLRRTSLDELPQLINVLRGEMSLVGPRPERPEYADQFVEKIPGYWSRVIATPGMTGLAQVRGLRGATSMRARTEADLEYIHDWSLVLDVKILLRTVGCAWSGGDGSLGRDRDDDLVARDRDEVVMRTPALVVE